MKTKKFVSLKVVATLVVLIVCATIKAQVKYDSNGRFTIGNTTPYGFYSQTISGNGMYFKAKTSNFFQIDVTPAATRLASHYDQVVFITLKVVFLIAFRLKMFITIRMREQSLIYNH